MTTTTIRLTPELRARLKARCERLSARQSEAIRMMVSYCLDALEAQETAAGAALEAHFASRKDGGSR